MKELDILCENFVNDHPIEEEMIDEEGRLDAQYFFETVLEEDLIEFFQELYIIMKNGE